ncbi:hypothetical protein C8P68_101508 [Mucilaginibacter yixingensis]|uniref:Uncharacterized protein n=2 Tax=Mucilaginibacter yixingensis TaxID=1295612 RepID=A0A2T5JFV7_9SPHI|nr:hypothetical protein C8P68_101508 [Mucilaginibacter yixingensis]
MLHGRNKMQQMAINLPPVQSYPDGLPIYFLTGRNYLYQTLFCIQSLVRVTTAQFKFILVDDGTFNHQITEQIKRQLPGAAIIMQETIEQNLNTILPAVKFQALRNKRKVYPHLKKLTDIHALPGNEWKLVMDSDMLFWHEPKALINWLKHPQFPIYMVDCVESYGYTTQLMKSLCGTNLPTLINVGIIGLNSNSINWQDLESWTSELEAKEGPSYYLEQALTAMLIGQQPALVLSGDDYIVNPDKNIIYGQQKILHHYVDLSKEFYFKHAWQQIAIP